MASDWKWPAGYKWPVSWNGQWIKIANGQRPHIATELKWPPINRAGQSRAEQGRAWQSRAARGRWCHQQEALCRLPVDDDVQSIAAARRTQCDQYEALFIQSGLGRDSYLYGIGSSSRLPANDYCFQFIAAARRKQYYQYEAGFIRSGLGRGSYL